MGTPEIFLEHKRGERHQRFMKVQPGRQLFLIGSSKEADLRISGEGITGCHAALRYRAPHWYVCDLSGTESLRVGEQSVSEVKVDGKATVEINGHRFQLFTKEKDNALFKDSEGRGDLALHQVVIRTKSGRVVETQLLRATESFAYTDGEATRSMPAPRDGKWLRTEIGTRIIQQRLVGSQEIALAEAVTFDRDLRKPMVAALLLLFMLASMVWIVSPSSEKKPEVALDKKSMDVIFNAKAIKKKRVEAQKVTKAAKAKAGGTSETATAPPAARSMPEESMAPKPVDKPSAALTSLRQAGLKSLVGKIAKRANKQGVMVAAQGVTPDTVGAGRAFFSNGTSTVGGGGSAAKEGPQYRLGGIATKGRAGGVGNVKDGTALAGGSVGTGNVVALVDEETVVEGGLDRDAIAEVIRRNIGQIRYCYERQLSSNPELYGKILVKWTIGSAGEVGGLKVDTTTLKSAMVEGCIMRRMASWQFPVPKGGTQVNVTYPFLFKAN
jgi:outer membrane biosynthesis protein TonB